MQFESQTNSSPESTISRWNARYIWTSPNNLKEDMMTDWYASVNFQCFEPEKMQIKHLAP